MTALYTCDGKQYRGMQAVADAHGVRLVTARMHFHVNGTLDGLGRYIAEGRDMSIKRVEIDGLEWPSRSALAAYLGLPRKTVCDWLDAGRTDRIARAIAAVEGAQ